VEEGNDLAVAGEEHVDEEPAAQVDPDVDDESDDFVAEMTARIKKGKGKEGATKRQRTKT
jgi:hypothetical protein